MSEDRDDQVRGALVKGLVALVAIAAAIGLGTLLMVRALGLDDGGGTVVGAPSSSDPLPTRALPGASEESSPTSGPASESPSESASDTALSLDVSPKQVGVSQRINLTGSYRGGDNVTLQIQRLEAGTWTDFPVTVDVTAGTFQTWIQTSRTGEQTFRVLDPQGDVASNEVDVTVG